MTDMLRQQRASTTLRQLCATILFLSLISPAICFTENPFMKRANLNPAPIRKGPPIKRATTVPLIIQNLCPETIWPGIGTQAGTGAGTGGFELPTGHSKELAVSADWQGRVWGRTNCSFNADGSGASNLNGYNGAGAACTTGDCGGVLDCVITGATPVTLAEMLNAGGVGGTQAFYDISCVDGYNIPVGMQVVAGDNAKIASLPPNLICPACVATAGYLGPPVVSGTSGNISNSTYPIPYESAQTDSTVASWCPWDLQVKQPTKPGDGVYPYPDDNIQRPIFDPCFSACAKSNSPEDCCTGKYNDAKVCKPNEFSKSMKSVCPDAYSFAFDDQTSTFIIPSGGGWGVTFCPEGRSTNILKTFGTQMQALSQKAGVTRQIIQDAMNITIIQEAARSDGSSLRTKENGKALGGTSLGALVVVVAWAVLW